MMGLAVGLGENLMAKVTARLTDLQIRQISAPGFYSDGSNLYLKVRPGAEPGELTRCWILRVRVKVIGRHGYAETKVREMGLGAYPDVKAAQARVLAQEARQAADRGDDPIQSRIDEKRARETERLTEAARLARALKFRQCVDGYVAGHAPTWREGKHKDQWANSIKNYAYPVIGELPVCEVNDGHIVQILESLWTSKTFTARRLRQRLAMVLDWAKSRGLREGENPARFEGHLEHILAKRAVTVAAKHFVALPFEEVPDFMAELGERESPAAFALQLLILTAVRTNEILKAPLEEFNLEHGVWEIPAARMKMSRPHRIPLSSDAIALLERWLPRRGKRAASSLLFPGQKRGRPLSDMAMLKLLRDMGRKGLTVQGFRASFRTWSSETTSHPGEIAEAALAHVAGKNAVEAAYLRGDLFEKRRRLMQDWADFCLGRTTLGGQVVEFKRAAGGQP